MCYGQWWAPGWCALGPPCPTAGGAAPAYQGSRWVQHFQRLSHMPYLMPPIPPFLGVPCNVMHVIFSPAFRECSIIISTLLMPLSPFHAYLLKTSKTGLLSKGWGRNTWICGSGFGTVHFAPLTSSVDFISVAQLCLTLCNPMDCSIPIFPVYQLLGFSQTHVHWVSDAIQPSHPLSSPSPPAFNLSQHQDHFKWVSSSHQVAKVLEFKLGISTSNEYSGLISFRMDWLDLLAVQGTLKSLLQHHSSKASILWSLACNPTLTSIHDYWKNHSFD